MFCPFCGVKNDAGLTSCFVCQKRLPSLDPETPQPRARPTLSRGQSTVPAPARLGDRLIAVILDTLLLIAVAVVSAAALSSSIDLKRVRVSTPWLIVGGAAAILLLIFLYHWILEGAFGATMGKAIVGV